MDDKTTEYETPRVADYGTLEELTANDGAPTFVDVPQGSPGTGVITGSDPFPGMS